MFLQQFGLLLLANRSCHETKKKGGRDSNCIASSPVINHQTSYDKCATLFSQDFPFEIKSRRYVREGWSLERKLKCFPSVTDPLNSKVLQGMCCCLEIRKACYGFVNIATKNSALISVHICHL